MYPGTHARERADQAAFIMASTGESVCYAEYEARTNRLAQLLRARGLGRLDHYAIFMENNDRTWRRAVPASGQACTTRASTPT